MEYWSRRRPKSHQNISIVWKAIVLAFPLVGKWLVWKVGKGNKVTLQEDHWLGCGDSFRLSRNLFQTLQEKGLYKLPHVADHNSQLIGNNNGRT